MCSKDALPVRSSELLARNPRQSLDNSTALQYPSVFYELIPVLLTITAPPLSMFSGTQTLSGPRKILSFLVYFIDLTSSATCSLTCTPPEVSVHMRCDYIPPWLAETSLRELAALSEKHPWVGASGSIDKAKNQETTSCSTVQKIQIAH